MILAVDIETIPDIAALRILHDLPADLAASEVAEYAFQRNRAARGHDFLQPHVHAPVVIACASFAEDQFKIWSLAQPEMSEGEMLRRFFSGFEKFTPQLVTWNGKGFDLPVLHYRSLMHRVQAPRYWDWGDGDFSDSRDFKWNNYLSRYQQRHLDLMDVLALYNSRNFVALEQLARLMGLPGKQGMSGAEVWPAWQAGEYAKIRHYCEADAVLTYLIHLHFLHMRGVYDNKRLQQENDRVYETLARQGEMWREFLEEWDRNSSVHFSKSDIQP